MKYLITHVEGKNWEKWVVYSREWGIFWFYWNELETFYSEENAERYCQRHATIVREQKAIKKTRKYITA